MQWDAGPNAGFSTAEPWLPVAPDYKIVNVKAQRANPTSMLSLYRRLIWTRKASPALLSGRYFTVDDVPEDCFAYLREHAEQRMLVALNFSDDEHRLSLPDLGVGQLVISTHLDREGTVDLAALHLREHEGAIVDLRSSP